MTINCKFIQADITKDFIGLAVRQGEKTYEGKVKLTVDNIEKLCGFFDVKFLSVLMVPAGWHPVRAEIENNKLVKLVDFENDEKTYELETGSDD